MTQPQQTQTSQTRFTGYYTAPSLNGQKPPYRYNVWLRRYYMKQFKKKLAAFGNNK